MHVIAFMKIFSVLLFFLVGCTTGPSPQEIINASIQAHGLDQLNGKRLAFDFRDKHYELERSTHEYVYTRSFQDSLGHVEDRLVNSHLFTRAVDGKEIEIADEWKSKYANSVNSVLYFTQLPFMLNDPAVLRSYQGLVEIKGKQYHQLEIRFQEQDGGVDFEDVFLYWFADESSTMDYLAYSYITDGGGVRFREAINRRSIDGVIFQDYINYKPKEKHTSLDSMLELFKSGQLVELSRIENKNITLQ